MSKKTILPFVGVVMLLVAAAAIFILSRQPSATDITGAAPGVISAKVVQGTLVSSSPAGITVREQDGTQTTLALSPGTQVISQVANGQVGKSLSDIATGTLVFVATTADDPTAAAVINIASAPLAPVSLQGPPAFVLGTFVSRDARTLSVKQADGSVTTVILASGVAVLSNVSAGQAGKTLDDLVPGESVVQVSGTAGTAGITAEIIQVQMPATF